MTEICRMRSSSFAESLAGSSVGSGRFRLPSWWWMWKSRVPFSSHCCLQRTRGMSSEFPEISVRHKRQMKGTKKQAFPRNHCQHHKLELFSRKERWCRFRFSHYDLKPERHTKYQPINVIWWVYAVDFGQFFQFAAPGQVQPNTCPEPLQHWPEVQGQSQFLLLYWLI